MFAQLIGSPMSLYDFYMYLKYIELSPENLEFYLWFVAPHGLARLRSVQERVWELVGAAGIEPATPAV